MNAGQFLRELDVEKHVLLVLGSWKVVIMQLIKQCSFHGHPPGLWPLESASYQMHHSSGMRDTEELIDTYVPQCKEISSSGSSRSCIRITGNVFPKDPHTPGILQKMPSNYSWGG